MVAGATIWVTALTIAHFVCIGKNSRSIFIHRKEFGAKHHHSDTLPEHRSQQFTSRRFSSAILEAAWNFHPGVFWNG
jgi:hypothetical protein